MKLPRWLTNEMDSAPKTNTLKKEANSREKKLTKRMADVGGKRQPVSGAFWDRKGDILIGDFALGDAKGTKYDSISVTRLMWEKINKETMLMGKRIPFLQLEMSSVEPLVVISENDFLLFMELLRENEKE